jgi:hypothetical protein
LRVLTQYKSIEDIDIAYELSKTRKRGEHPLSNRLSPLPSKWRATTSCRRALTPLSGRH